MEKGKDPGNRKKQNTTYATRDKAIKRQNKTNKKGRESSTSLYLFEITFLVKQAPCDPREASNSARSERRSERPYWPTLTDSPLAIDKGAARASRCHTSSVATIAANRYLCQHISGTDRRDVIARKTNSQSTIGLLPQVLASNLAVVSFGTQNTTNHDRRPKTT